MEPSGFPSSFGWRTFSSSLSGSVAGACITEVLREPRVAAIHAASLLIDGNTTATRELPASYSPAELGKVEMKSDRDEVLARD
jgi:hypothetical protein